LEFEGSCTTLKLGGGSELSAKWPDVAEYRVNYFTEKMDERNLSTGGIEEITRVGVRGEYFGARLELFPGLGGSEKTRVQVSGGDEAVCSI